MTFIFDRCHRIWAAETPVKYERDLKYMTYYCDKSKFSVTEKLTNGPLVTPTPVLRKVFPCHDVTIHRELHEWFSQLPCCTTTEGVVWRRHNCSSIIELVSSIQGVKCNQHLANRHFANWFKTRTHIWWNVICILHCPVTRWPPFRPQQVGFYFSCLW